MTFILLSGSQQTDAFPLEVDVPAIAERFGRPEPRRTAMNPADLPNKRGCRVKSCRVWIKQWELYTHPFLKGVWCAGGGSRDEGSIVLFKKPQNKHTLQTGPIIHYLI